VINWSPETNVSKKCINLNNVVSEIDGWSIVRQIALPEKIVKSLNLDEYINQVYSNKYTNVSLYIGYYYTSKKIGAAHSPLVCYPGQGWIVSKEEKRKIGVGDDSINLSSIIISKGNEKNLVLYWFQAFDKTFPGTFLQKIYAFFARFLYHREDNAFVRISIPIINRQSKGKALSTGQEFREAFYPRFLEYVIESRS